MCDLPRPGIKPISPALAGRFLTTGQPAKSYTFLFSFKKGKKKQERCQQGYVPSNVYRRGVFLLLQASGSSQHSLPCGRITPVSASIFTNFFLCLKSPLCLSFVRTLVISFRAHPDLEIPHFITSAKTAFQINSQSQVPGVRIRR